jgi:chemotaxis protein methyltransferase CheR
MSTRPADPGVEAVELELLLEGVFRRYGYDFRHYARASLKRRISGFLPGEKLATLSALQERLLRDPACFARWLLAVTVNVSAMFRDPGFWLGFRQQVAPLLRTYPSLRLWCAGASTGEEVYSLAILLEEEGLYGRCQLYATDLNEAVLEKAREGIFPLAAMKEHTANYLKAGGRRAFSEYYTAAYDLAIFRPELREQVLFAQHSLVSDASFGEFQAILCRNVLIYFDRALQGRAHELFYESLCPLGFLCLGAQESIQFSPREKEYDLFHAEKIYQKVR